MASYLWRKYADYVYTKWERMILWNMVEPYSRPKSFTPLVTIYVAAFYTGVIGSAITEQLYKVITLLGKILGRTSRAGSASYEAKVLRRTVEGTARRGPSHSVKAIDQSEKLLYELLLFYTIFC
nr:uncharacterized protein LOC103453203 isoform X2 [Malus domestica]